LQSPAPDGYCLLLEPFAAGAHTIHFTGGLTFTAAQHGFDWPCEVDVTYAITVQ
jgi:hypothetical protein